MRDHLTREKILVIRFSALGDVAMTVPVVKAFLAHHPDKEILFLGDKKMAGLFHGIDRLDFFGAELGGEHHGFSGIIRLFNSIRKKYAIDVVVDLHGVLRTHVLRSLFRLIGKRTGLIDKGRFEKFALTRKEDKIFRPLRHSTDRYLDVFALMGYEVEGFRDELHRVIDFSDRYKNRHDGSRKKIGFAPFAKHDSKMYFLDEFKKIVSHFDTGSYELYFFGGKGAEQRILTEWSSQFRHVISLPVNKDLKMELEIMQNLDLLLTMDSANMHLASLAGVPVVSIWGATHPYAGFYGYNQDPLNAVQISLGCRPCSVFGNKPCWRGDHACMREITPAMVIEKMESVLNRK